jgi:hypothetical protein
VRTVVSCLLAALVLAGCGLDFNTSFVSGEVLSYVDGRELSRRSLSPDQLQQLTQWLDQHRSGWQGMLAETPPSSTRIELQIKDQDGGMTSVLAITPPNGGRYLLVHGPGKWAYQSYGGFIKSWAAARRLSDRDFSILQNLAGKAG